MEGTALAAFPKLELKRPPKDVMDDPEVKRLWLAYRRGADELRVEMASEVPYARKPQEGRRHERVRYPAAPRSTVHGQG